jgi:hypothetical protein
MAAVLFLGAAMAAGVAEEDQTCRKDYVPIALDADIALLLGVATGEHVSVPPGDVVYYDRSQFIPEETDVPVRGYRVLVQAFHHATAQGLAGVFEGSDAKAILVPWGCRGDWKTVRWDEAAGRWISAREPAVFRAVLRPLAAPDGTPIFDVYSAHFEPYPTAKWVRDRLSDTIRGGRKFLTAQEYFIFAASLPVRDPKTDALSGAERIRRWAAENPGLARRWPAVESLEALRARGIL